MDWIERIFGISPDHGSGMLELEIFASLLAAAAIVAVWALVGRRGGRSRKG